MQTAMQLVIQEASHDVHVPKDVRRNASSAHGCRAGVRHSRAKRSAGEYQRDAVPECAHLRWQEALTLRTSNVLIKGNIIERISTAPIATEPGVTVIAGNGRTLMPGLIDAHWHAMLIRPNPAQAISGDVGYNNIAAGVEATDTLMRGFTTVRDVGGPVFGLKSAID